MTAFEPLLEDFTALYERGGALVSANLISDLETPLTVMMKLSETAPGAFLLESSNADDGGGVRTRYSIIGIKPDLVWRVKQGRAEISAGGFADTDFSAQKEAPLDSLRALLQRSRLTMPPGLPAPAAGLFGYLGYDMARYIERLPAAAPDPIGAPEAVLMRPTVVVVFDNRSHETKVVTAAWREGGQSAADAYAAACARLESALSDLYAPLPQRAPPAAKTAAPAQAASNTTPEAYRATVERCKEYVRAGDVFQVVPSQRFSLPLQEPPFALYRALHKINPSPFQFYLNFGEFSVVGASPEILVRLEGKKITIRPIAGTRPRGATPEEDRRLEEELLADPKERAEHLMLLDLGRNDVGRVARRDPPRGYNVGAGSGSANVRVTESFKVQYSGRVMSISSNVEGVLADGLGALDALLAGFPAGTLTGAPKVRAMQIIAEREPHNRGIYGGAIGYFSANGDMDTCIAIRTGIIKDGTLYIQAGGGVVYDSDPETEFQETRHKARILFNAAAEAWRYV
jgi:anthranilate synthase component I